MTKQTTSWWWAVMLLIMLGLGAASFWASDENRGTSRDGARAVAKVLAARDGDCAVGVKRQHCFELELEVNDGNSSTFISKIDVNVEDRYAARIEPTRWVFVRLTGDDARTVLLDVEAFQDAAPQPPRP